MQVEATQLMDLPDQALLQVLAALPLDQLCGPCSLVCRRLQATAASAAATVKRLDCSSSSQEAAAAIEQCLRMHGSQLEALELRGSEPCSVPWEQLNQLLALKLGKVRLSKTSTMLPKSTALTSLQLDSCHIMDDEIGTCWLAWWLRRLPRLRHLQVERLFTQFEYGGAAPGGAELNDTLKQLTLLTSFTLTRTGGVLGGEFTALSCLSQLQYLKLAMVGSDVDPLSLTSLPSSLTALQLQECIVSRLSESSSGLQLPHLQQLHIADVCPSQTPAYMRRVPRTVPESAAALTAAASEGYAALLSTQLRSLSFDVPYAVSPGAAAGVMHKLLQLQQLTSLRIDLGSPSLHKEPHSIPTPAFSSFSALQELYLVGVGCDSHPVDFCSLPSGLTALGMWECTFKGPDTTFSSKLCSTISSVCNGLAISSSTSSSTSCKPELQSLVLNGLCCCNGPWAGSASLGAFLAQQPHVTRLALDSPFLGVPDGSHLRHVLSSVSLMQQLQHLSVLWASADISTNELQQLLQLTVLTELHAAGDGWDDAAANGVLAHMTGATTN
jgi:hypothetical protein